MAISPAVWLEDLDGDDLPSVTRRYTKVYFIALAYLALPLFFGSAFNYAGWEMAVWATLLLTTLVDFWMIFHPFVPGGITLAGYLRGQPGGSRGLSINEGLEKAWEWIRHAYGILALVILGKNIALVVLGILPLEGFGLIALIILSLIGLVVLGNVYYSSDPWVIKWFWLFYCAIVVALIGYWVVVWQFPELRPSAARAEFKALEVEVARQNEEQRLKEVADIRTRMEQMPKHFTVQERLNELSQDERRVMEGAQRGSFAHKSYDKAAPVIGDSAKSIKDGAETFGSWYQHAIVEPWMEKSFDFRVINLKGEGFCHPDLKDGRRKFSADPSTEVWVLYQGQWQRPKIGGYIRANGMASGESLQIKGGCVDISYVFAEAGYENNQIKTQTVRITFGPDWTYYLIWLICFAITALVLLWLLGKMFRRGHGHRAGHH